MVLAADPTTLARRVWVKIVDPASGRTLFKHEDAITIEASGEGHTVQLQLVPSDDCPPIGSRLVVQVSDADDDLLLERQEVQLKVQMDDW